MLFFGELYWRTDGRSHARSERSEVPPRRGGVRAGVEQEPVSEGMGKPARASTGESGTKATGQPEPGPRSAGRPRPRLAMPLVAVLAIGGPLMAARWLEGIAKEQRGQDPAIELPYAPSAAAAPFVSLGYREAMADALSLRLRGYFGGRSDDASGSADLAEAILALDPRYQRMYEYSARAITMADAGTGNGPTLRAIALLERGAVELPDDWRIPFLAGQLYSLELETTDAALRRRWDEKGALLIEGAIRKPGASAESATFAAHLRTKLGQHQAAVDGLREMLLVTSDDAARARMLAKLGELEQQDSAAIAEEILGERQRFEKRWKAERPSVPPTMYLLVGKPLAPAFDLTELAVGGRALIGSDDDDALEPLE